MIMSSSVDLYSEWYDKWSNYCMLNFACKQCKFNKDGICNDLARADAKLLKNNMID